MYKIFPWCHCDTDQRKKKKQSVVRKPAKKLKAYINPAFGLNYGLLPAPTSAYNMSQ